MFMLVNKILHVSGANDVEMVSFGKKKFIFVNRVIESYSRIIKAK